MSHRRHPPRHRTRNRVLAVLLTGAALAAAPVALAVALWPRPVLTADEALTIRFQSASSTRPLPSIAPAPSPEGEPEPSISESRTPAPGTLSWPAERRVRWVHERAVWSGGGWVLCDASTLGDLGPRPLASLVPDEHGVLLSKLDPASSQMFVHDGWLALAVRPPDGSVAMEIGAQPAWVEWSGARGELPGHCTIRPRAEVAHIVVEPILPDGSPWRDAPLQVVGCGRQDDTGAAMALDHNRPCSVAIRRTSPWLSTQATVGPAVPVLPIAGKQVVVQAVVPEDPADTLPRLDQTLALLDLAAFSGADLAADYLDVVLDDLEAGHVDVEPLHAGLDLLDSPDGVEISSPTQAVEVAWAAWIALDDHPPG